MIVGEYTEKFYKMCIRLRHDEDGMEKLARYINGLRYDIQDEINLLILKKIEGAYQATLKAEEKFLRKQSQKNRGNNLARGRGASIPRFQHSMNEMGGTSNQPPQRGDYGRGIFGSRGRIRGREI